jgi:hypothetical protein
MPFFPDRNSPNAGLARLRGAGGEDITVTGIEDSHGRATEELTASGTELNLYGSSQPVCYPPKPAPGSFAGWARDLMMWIQLDWGQTSSIPHHQPQAKHV